MQSIGKRALSALVLAASSLLLTALAAEIGLRATRPVLNDRHPSLIDDPALGTYRVRARQGFTNALGFADLDVPFEKPPLVYRIVGLGDSFAYGTVRLADNYHRVLEAMLNRSAPLGGVRFQVVNRGVPTYGPHDALIMLRNHAVRFNPDLVLLGFFMGNDLYDNRPDMQAVILNGQLLRVPSAWWQRLRWRYSALLFYTKSLLLPAIERWKKQRQDERVRADPREHRAPTRPDALRQAPVVRERDGYRELPPAQAPVRTVPNSNPEFADDTILRIEYGVSNTLRKSWLGSSFFLGQLAFVQATLKEIKAVSNVHSATFVLALFPDRLVVDEELWRALVTRFELNKRDYDFDRPANLLKEFCRNEGIPVVDLTPRFKQVGRQERLYARGDTHWNAKGNRLAAKEIYKFLVRENLTPRANQR